MPTVTQQAYFRRTLDRLLGHRVLQYGTATGSGSTTTILTGNQLATSISQTSALIGTWVRTTTSGTTEYSKVASVSAAGVITVDRAITSTTSSTDFELTGEINPRFIERIIDAVLQNTYTPRLFPLTSHIITNDDNDMESTATITGMWSNSSGTLAKETTIVPMLGGLQSLKITATATPGYAYLASDIPVHAQRQYRASVLCSVTAGDSAEFRVVNVDDSNATIENATTDEVLWTHLSFDFTTPSGCERINTFLIGTTNTDVVYFDDLSIVDTDQIIFPTPSWLVLPTQFKGVLEFPRGVPGPTGDNDYRLWERGSIEVGSLVGPPHFRSNQELAIQVRPHSGYRRYIYALAPGAALTTNASVGYIDVDVVAENAARLIEVQEAEGGRAAMWKHLARIREQSLASDVPMPEERGVAYFA